ncbi:arylesterase [Pacificimonas sp. ICDLI1SI03]
MPENIKPHSYGGMRAFVHAALMVLAFVMTAPALAQTKTVLAFGDSLMAGYQLDQGDGFAPQLERELGERGIDARVIGAGVSGDTSRGGLQRIGWTLDNLPVKPDLVIVELGANDMLRNLDPKQTLRNLNGIIEEIDRRGIDVLIAGMLATPNVGEERFRYFNRIYPFLARRHDVPLYPFFLRGVAMRQKYLLEDYLHPNAEGVKIIVEGIAPSVVQALN